jgi:hypothetical protein
MVVLYYSEHRWYRGGRTTHVQQDVASGAAGGYIGRQPVTDPRLELAAKPRNKYG